MIEKLKSENKKAEIARKDYEQKSAQIRAQHAEASAMARITDDAKRKQRTAERRLDEAEDLLENPPMEPDISKDDQQIASLAEKINELFKENCLLSGSLMKQ